MPPGGHVHTLHHEIVEPLEELTVDRYQGLEGNSLDKGI